MRSLLLSLLLACGLPVLLPGQACTGLCLQQVACGSGTTSVSGTVYSPNGVDPLPNVLVFVPNAQLRPMSPGVACAVPGAAPDGSPLVGTTTAADGTFRIDNVPVGTDVPLVIQTGRWRRLVKIPTVTQCTNNTFSTRMPRNQSEGDIPQFAVATGSADQVECALRKVGLDDAEFTNPLSTGRIHLYGDVGSRGGAVIDANTPTQGTLMSDLSRLEKYDVLMLPCEGGEYKQQADSLSNLVRYADKGGRVYASHFSYVWMYQNAPFNTVVNWHVSQSALADGPATISSAFYGATTLTTWLQTVNASSTPGQIDLIANKHDLDGVNPPTQAWITLNDPVHNNPVMQLTFNTPVGAANQCGRVLFNEYHVENRDASMPSPSNKPFPVECSNAAMTPQEKLLEYSLFDLSNDGGQPTLTPTSADFGTVYLGFSSPVKTFTWTNNSIFTASVSSAVATGDFAVLGNTCSSVISGKSCTIQVVFKPTAMGPANETLTVTSNSSKIVATLTGNGSSPLVLSSTGLVFGNTDVGFPATQSMTLQNVAPGPITLAAASQAGDFALASTCGTTLAAGAGCTVNVTFKPSATGMRTGQIAFNGQAVTFSGNGVDFTAAFTPASGNVIAGLETKAPMAVLPLAGFSANVQLSCSTTVPGSTCTVSTGSVVPSATAGASVQITTTAKYTVIGYGGVGGAWSLGLLSLAGTACLWRFRRRAGRYATVLCLGGTLLCTFVFLTGCGSKAPALNPVYTSAGAYTYTVTATDGFLVHTATYSLNVTAK